MQTAKPLVSIVIPSYNSMSLIKSCLENILHITYQPLEIIIVDDGSTDGSDTYIEDQTKTYSHLKLIRNNKNSGPSFTRNNGIKHAQGKYIALLETDMEVEPNWLEPLVTELEDNLELGAVQSKVLDLYQRDVIAADGVFYDPHTFWVVCHGCGMPKDSANERKLVSIGAVGCVIRKSVLDTIGGFDEKIVHNIDDIDLGWRIWLTGHKIIFIPESVTYHWTMKPLDLRSQTTPSEKSEFYFQKTPRIFLKNYSWFNILRYMPWLYAVFTVRALSNLMRGNVNPLKGLLKATWWNINNVSDTLAERRRIQALRKFDDTYLLNTIFLKGSFFDIYHHQIKGVLQRAQSSLLNNAKEFFPDICYICNQPFVIKNTFGPLNQKYYYRECNNCTGAMLYPYPKQAGFQEKYSQENYYEELSQPVKNSLIDRILNLRTYQIQSEYIKSLRPKGKVLDVGCGNGQTLDELKQHGWDVYGNDISEIAVRKTGQRIGDASRILHGEFCKTTFHTKFDVISFWHVLEHIDNPHEYLNQVLANLKPGGYLAAEVPNYDSLTFHLTKQHYSWIMLPEHNLYYSVRSMEKMLTEVGFTNIVIECPMRAILNLSNSLRNIMRAKQTPPIIEKIIYISTLPLTFLAMFIFCTIGKGEVIRVKAQKPVQ